MKHKLLTIGAIFLTTISLAACGSKKSASTHRALSVTLPDEPLTADPNKATDTNSAGLIFQTMEGLYTYNKQNKIIPGVATKVVKPTNNGKTYTFNLKRNAKWANGQPVTAQDFVNSFRRTVDPKTKAQYANLYSAFKNYSAIQAGKLAPNKLGAKAIGRHKLQIQLTKRIPWFNDLAASKYLPLNTAAVKKYGQKYGTNASKTMADGPYKLVGWTGSNSSWKYVKNPHYWNAKNVKINQVNVSVTKDENTAINLFKSGKIQETTVTGQYVRANASNPDLKKHATSRLNYLYFNPQIKKTNSENLRKALGYIINQKTITQDVLQDGSKPTLNMVIRGDQKNPKTGKDMAEDVGNLLPTSVSKAKNYWNKYLKESGKKSVTMNLLTDDTDEDKHIGAYIQSIAQKNFKGLTINLTSLPHAQHVARDFDGKFELNLTGWSTNWRDSYDFLSLMAKDNSVNFAHWNDPTFNKLLNTANAKTGQARYDGLVQADKYLMKVMGCIPLYQPSEAKLISSKVGGLTYSLLNEAQYQYAYWK